MAPRIPREIAALIHALQLHGATTQPLRELTAGEWETLLTFSDLAHLTLPLAQLETGDFPSWVAERLKKNLADNAARFERVRATYKELAGALDQAQVDYVVLKGFTQAPEYVCDPRLRAQSDLDLYLPDRMIESAQVALEGIGYRSDTIQDFTKADHVPTMTRLGNWQWRGNLFDPDMPLSIDLHFCLWNSDTSLFPVPDVESFWKRRSMRTVNDLTFPALSRVDHLAQLTLHILRNLFAGDWIIHHVRELASFLHGHVNDDGFWKEWKQTHSSSLRALAAIAFFHGRAWFSCDFHPEVEKEIAALPLPIKKWLDRFAGSALEGMFRQNKDFIWLHAELLPSANDKLSFLRRALIPRRVPRSHENPVRFKNRKAREFGSITPRLRYLEYLMVRLAAHGRMIPATLLRGLGWWLSQRQLGR